MNWMLMILLSEKTVACRHLGRFFRISVEYNLEPVEFILKALKSEYKEGIEQILSHCKIYHTVDPLVVLEDSIDVNNIEINFEEILI